MKITPQVNTMETTEEDSMVEGREGFAMLRPCQRRPEWATVELIPEWQETGRNQNLEGEIP
jgi:hypothetical protein